MGIGDIAGLIAAIAFAILAGFMIYPLIRLGKMFDQIGKTVKDAGDHAIPALDESVTTVRQVNRTLSDVNQISDSAQYTARNVGALTDLYSSLLSKPAIKIASGIYAAGQTLSSFFGRKKTGKTASGASAPAGAKKVPAASGASVSSPSRGSAESPSEGKGERA